FTVVNGNIRFGLAAIKNVGEGAVEVILAARREGEPFRSMFDFCERVDLRAVNRRVVESFIKSGSFDSLDKRRALLMDALDRAMEAGQKQQRDREQGQASLFGGPEPGESRQPERLQGNREWPEGERLAYEKESLGFFITGHPLERHKDELAQWASATTGALGQLGDREATVGGIVTGLRLLKTKKGDRMATFILQHPHAPLELPLFPQAYPHPPP